MSYSALRKFYKKCVFFATNFLKKEVPNKEKFLVMTAMKPLCRIQNDDR